MTGYRTPICKRTLGWVVFVSYVLLCTVSRPVLGDDSILVSEDYFGQLVYSAYANRGQDNAVNTVPDYSRAGYQGGGVPIPFVPAAVVLEDDGAADDTERIQAAIDMVAGMPQGPGGFRGAVLLTAGEYSVSEQLDINDSGVVLRGEGSQADGGTRITFTSTAPAADKPTLIRIDGGGAPTLSMPVAVTDSHVPVGADSFTVADASGFAVGDMIRISRTTNDTWITDLGMGAYGWTADAYPLTYERFITHITGDTIHLDAPVIQAIEDRYGGAQVALYTHPEQIRNNGVEALRLESVFAHTTDEDHGWNAIVISNARDAWVRQVTARHFAYSCVFLKQNTHFVTVEDSAQLDPKSEIDGARRYSFVADDASYILFQRNFTRGGRHDFVTHSQTPGPHVFVDSRADEAYSDVGPHHRYAFGGLYDNIMSRAGWGRSSAGRINVQNRRTSGTGHGWAGAQIMLWNNDAKGATVDAPPGAMNWSVGFVGSHEQGAWPPAEPDGIWQSEGAHVSPRSLYYKQLEERLGRNAVHSVILPEQDEGSIWEELKAWAGDGLLLEDVIAWREDGAPGMQNSVRVRAIVRNLRMLDSGVTVAWTKVSGPGTVSFADSTALDTTATLSESGAYELLVTVDDGSVQRSASIDVDTGFRINAGLNDAWYYPVTDGQGFFISVFPDKGRMSVSWFTYDTERPGPGVVANLGDPGHRWFNASGRYEGNRAVLTIKFATGGIFDAATEIERYQDGTMVLTFDDCNNAVVEYDIPSVMQSGIVPIQRIAGDNIALCEALAYR
jgi:hypothetical protein